MNVWSSCSQLINSSWIFHSTRTEKILLCCLVACHVLVYLFVLDGVSFFADEPHYSNIADLLCQSLTTSNLHDRGVLINRIVGVGFFMPFYSMILVPLKLFDLSDSSIRVVFMLINILLAYFLTGLLRRHFNRTFSVIFLAILATSPTMLLYDASILPEGISAKLILFGALIFYQFSQSGSNWSRLTAFTIVMVQLILFRQSTIFIWVGLCLWFIIQNKRLHNLVPSLKQLSSFVLPALIVIASSIFVWSTFLSAKFGPGYYTTTSTDLSFMVMWGEGMEQKGNPTYPSIWRRLNDHYTAKSEQLDISFKEAVSIDKAIILQELTVPRYLKGLKQNMKDFFSLESVQIRYMFHKAELINEQNWLWTLRFWNSFLCYVILSMTFLLLLFPRIISLNHRKILSLLIFIVPFLLVHIFVAKANGRHGMIVWWILAVIASCVIANACDALKASSSAILLKEPMSTPYKIIINTLRLFTCFLLFVLVAF